MKKNSLFIGVCALLLSACVHTPKNQVSDENNGAVSHDELVTHFKAYGYSPAWQAELIDNQLTFAVPDITDIKTQTKTVTVSREAYARGVTHYATDHNINMVFDIQSGPCHKNGREQEFKAILEYGKSIYKGCADRKQ